MTTEATAKRAKIGGSAASVFDFLVGLPKEILSQLYEDPWTCQSVFRSLSPLAKHYVFRLLYASSPYPPPQGGSRAAPQGVTTPTLTAWGKPGDHAQHTEAVRRLKDLMLLDWRTEGDKGPTYVFLAPKFQQQLQRLLRDGGQLLASEVSAAVDAAGTGEAARVTPQLLHEHAHTSFEALLHFILGSPVREISGHMLDLILGARLMVVEDDGARITNEGFQFALKDTTTQLWTLLMCYLGKELDYTQRQLDKRHVLSLLFRLGFVAVGRPCPTAGLSATQCELLSDLHELGVVYLPPSPPTLPAPHFYPTPLALHLASGSHLGAASMAVGRHAAASSDQQQQQTTAAAADVGGGGVAGGGGYLIVESSYRLYAYTSSDLHAALLGLFVRLTYRLPNLLVGIITRDSIRAAIKTGISADQIIQFLDQNTHPQANKRFPRVPETVTDQIRLWEAERNRLTINSGTLFDNFTTVEAFKAVETYARDIGQHVWSKVDTAVPTKSMLFVTEAGHEQVRKFIKKH